MQTLKKQEIQRHLHTIRNHLQIIYLLTDQKNNSQILEDMCDIQHSAEIITDEIKHIETYL